MNTSGRKTVKGRTTSAPKISKTPASEAAVVTASTLEAKDAKDAKDAKAGKPQPSHEAIAHRAYQLYLERGGQPGDQAQDWLAAERELGG
jgi:hypothetical protein